MKRTKPPQRLATTFEVYNSDDRVQWQRSGGSKALAQAKAVALGWRKLGYYTRVVKVTRHVVSKGAPLKPAPKPGIAALFDTAAKAS